MTKTVPITEKGNGKEVCRLADEVGKWRSQGDDKLGGARTSGFRRDSGDTSSRLSAGMRMLIKPMSQSVGQTCSFETDSRGSDEVCDLCTGKGSLRAERRLNLKPYCGKTRRTNFRGGAGNRAMADLNRHEAGNGGYGQREPKATAPVLYSTEITIVSAADVFHLTEGSTLIAVSPNLLSWNIAGSSGTWRGDESPTGSETVAHAKHFDQTFLKFDMGTREAQGVLPWGVCPIKPMNGKIVQTTLWESDQLIVLTKQGNACGGKGLAVEPLGQGHIRRTKRRVKEGNKTGLITYPEKDREVLLKSWMRENLKSGSVRGLIAASGRRWL